MARVRPDFMVHAGDIEYYDRPHPYAKNAELARYKWNRLFALPFQREFYRSTAAYFMKDDHDILKNDAWPGMTYGDLTWDQGLEIFREQNPTGPLPYRSVRWGRHLQIWLVEGREYRSPNDQEDGPGKTIWGEEQKRWFLQSFANSDATFRVLISPTPIVGPDRPRKRDNHANSGFEHEGREVRDFLATQTNAFVICGDRHWQYASADTARGLREFGCGPGSDSHAGGWSEDMRTPEQTFLRLAGGYLRVSIELAAEGPQARVQHCDVNGKVVNEEILSVR
jgi:alkaline phosphatase D